MEGSVNALAVRESTMRITVADQTDSGGMVLQIDGYGEMGKAFDDSSTSNARTRGCELRIIGRLVYDPEKRKFTAFNLAGIGEAWGNKMEYTRREVRIPGERLSYGIACELVSEDAPYDRIPPCNMLHYGTGMKYFSSP